ncbi:unknown protein [Microcystis aeruginosa NIES-843]|uniref:Uncharacterized protein n=1 Tax=Microcystis aeruginosa (strain NIES-843 / IAM M-2473) TaxID=449447 RepID=B0JM85_MICAN|nr:unknown protein [Microcystis aeruginosa NIES-843]
MINSQVINCFSLLPTPHLQRSLLPTPHSPIPFKQDLVLPPLVTNNKSDKLIM